MTSCRRTLLTFLLFCLATTQVLSRSAGWRRPNSNRNGQWGLKPRQAPVCTEAGFHRNPNDCKLFYRCVDLYGTGSRYQIYNFQCPEGTVFDESISVCNHPYAAPPCDDDGSEVRPEAGPAPVPPQPATSAPRPPPRPATAAPRPPPKPATSAPNTPCPHEKEEIGALEQTTTTEAPTTTTIKHSPTCPLAQQSTTPIPTTTTEAPIEAATEGATPCPHVSTPEKAELGEGVAAEGAATPCTCNQTAPEPTTTTAAPTTTTTPPTTTTTPAPTTTTPAPTTTTPAPTTTTTPPTTTTIPTTTTTKPPPEVFLIPLFCGNKTIHHRHPLYCNRYYKCDSDGMNINFQVFDCPEGEVFEPQKNKCVPRDEAPPCNTTAEFETVVEPKLWRFRRSIDDAPAEPEPSLFAGTMFSCPKGDGFPYDKECSRQSRCADMLRHHGNRTSILYRCPKGFVFVDTPASCGIPKELRPCKNSPEESMSYRLPIEHLLRSENESEFMLDDKEIKMKSKTS